MLVCRDETGNLRGDQSRRVGRSQVCLLMKWRRFSALGQRFRDIAEIDTLDLVVLPR